MQIFICILHFSKEGEVPSMDLHGSSWRFTALKKEPEKIPVVSTGCY